MKLCILSIISFHVDCKALSKLGHRKVVRYLLSRVSLSSGGRHFISPQCKYKQTIGENPGKIWIKSWISKDWTAFDLRSL